MFQESRAGATSDYKTTKHSHSREKSIRKSDGLSWIEVAENAPYFVDENGNDWTPIGQNDAITWVDLAGAFRRRDLRSVENYFEMLAENGVGCLRLMLEYCQSEHRYLERPVGRFQPNMIRLWDDIFTLCGKYGLRILLTPYDTFWMWIRWAKHPYNRKNGGICGKCSEWLLCADTRKAIKNRLAFATERWGKSGALFAWDIWNEIHPAHGGDSADNFAEFVEDISGFLRKTESRLHGRTHPQTVSVFGPEIEKDARVAECAFRHPSLDFASIHFYEKGTIDCPENTVDAAISTGRLTRECLAEINDQRPFFDSEHGPIHLFKDKKVTLPEPFDDEYFRHIQWAHFASGGAGGGMRWANRHPHTLTRGMRSAQKALAEFLPLIDWRNFNRRNLNEEIKISNPACKTFGCGDTHQAVVWILRTDEIEKNGMMRQDASVESVNVEIPALEAGVFRITEWDTFAGCQVKETAINHAGGDLRVANVSIKGDVALAIRRI